MLRPTMPALWRDDHELVTTASQGEKKLGGENFYASNVRPECFGPE
jgi:hypothetical protein